MLRGDHQGGRERFGAALMTGSSLDAGVRRFSGQMGDWCAAVKRSPNTRIWVEPSVGDTEGDGVRFITEHYFFQSSTRGRVPLFTRASMSGIGLPMAGS
jgi:hypothetical protein